METTVAMRVIIRDKTKVFSDEEMLDKLVEELEEALEAVRSYQRDPDELTLKAMAEELADVRVAGEMTLSYNCTSFEDYFKAKVLRAMYDQIPNAIRERKSKSPG